MRQKQTLSLISRAHLQYQQHLHNLLQEAGFQPSFSSLCDVILVLSMKNKVTMSMVAEALDRDRSTVTFSVQKLEQLGYVRKERSVMDSRVVYVYLTQQGMELQPIVQAITSQALQQVFGHLSTQEMDDLRRKLQGINKALHRLTRK